MVSINLLPTAREAFGSGTGCQYMPVHYSKRSRRVCQHELGSGMFWWHSLMAVLQASCTWALLRLLHRTWYLAIQASRFSGLSCWTFSLKVQLRLLPSFCEVDLPTELCYRLEPGNFPCRGLASRMSLRKGSLLPNQIRGATRRKSPRATWPQNWFQCSSFSWRESHCS